MFLPAALLLQLTFELLDTSTRRRVSGIYYTRTRTGWHVTMLIMVPHGRPGSSPASYSDIIPSQPLHFSVVFQVYR